MMTLDLNKPIPDALFDLRPLIGPVAWSLLTALIENEYNDCPFGSPEPLSVDTLAEMTGLDIEETKTTLWRMQENAFIPVTVYFEVESAGRYRLNLDKLSRNFVAQRGE